MMRFGGARIWEPSEAERASTGYLTNVSPVDSDTQPISIGVLSSHTREAGDEEASSSRAGPVKGMTEDLKDSSWPALVSCVLDDRVSNVDKTHPMKRQRGLFRFVRLGACCRENIGFPAASAWSTVNTTT